jgi:hypothetical protein
MASKGVSGKERNGRKDISRFFFCEEEKLTAIVQNGIVEDLDNIYWWWRVFLLFEVLSVPRERIVRGQMCQRGCSLAIISR